MKFVNDKHVYNCRIICPHSYSAKSSGADKEILEIVEGAEALNN